MTQVTLARIREVLHYAPETGVFTWLVSTSNRVRVGDVAGNSSGHEYQRIRVDGKLYYAHRLARFYVTGEWPKNKVDHKDTSKMNNAWSNLRDATNQGNSANIPMKRTNSVGLKGVSRDGTRYRAHITVNGKYKHLGNFADPTLAHEAYVRAAAVHFGEFARHNDNSEQGRAVA